MKIKTIFYAKLCINKDYLISRDNNDELKLKSNNLNLGTW